MQRDFIFISDTHTHHESIQQQLIELYSSCEEAILIHTGDISYRGMIGEVKNFLEWFSGLPFKHKIMIAGNHDFAFEDQSSLMRTILREEYSGITYLEDSGVEIDGFKIWGSPVTPTFHNWAFNRDHKDIKKHWDAIPDDVDILLTHGPPYGILDQTDVGLNVGCPLLKKRIDDLPNLKIHAFGHIHESNGTNLIDEKIYVNSSIVDLDYEVKNPPYLIKL